MVQAGIPGFTDPPSSSYYAKCFSDNGNDYAKAARCFNTGSIPDEADLRSAGKGRPTYVDQIANFVLGKSPSDLGLDGPNAQLCGMVVEAHAQ